MACCVLNFEQRARVKKQPLGTNDASDGNRPARSNAATGGSFLSAPARRLSFLGFPGWADAAPKPHAGSSDGDAAIELLSEFVTWLVLV